MSSFPVGSNRRFCINQVVRKRRGVEVSESGEPYEPGRLRMATQLVGGLGSDTPPIPLELVGKDPVKQIGRQPDPAIWSISNASRQASN